MESIWTVTKESIWTVTKESIWTVTKESICKFLSCLEIPDESLKIVESGQLENLYIGPGE